MKTPTVAAACAVLLITGLAGCGDREVEAKSGTAEAEVSTDAPPAQVSDQQLQAAAQDAANAAAGVAASADAPADAMSAAAAEPTPAPR